MFRFVVKLHDSMDNVRVFVKSFGCSANVSDGEFLAGCLAGAGFQLVDDLRLAHVVVYNTCGVKQPTEDRVIHELKKVPRDKKLIIVGCLPLINLERLRRETFFDAVAGPALGEGIVELVQRVLDGEKVCALDSAAATKPCLLLPKRRVNPVVGIVPISYGCSGVCAYCCVRFARGRLRSYGIDEVVERVKLDLREGVREVWLTAQDTGCYGRDIGVSLADLLNAVCRLPGRFYVRVGMMTPNFALEILDELVEAFQNEHVFKFLHLPVQSGDNQVLKLMNRKYTVEEFQLILKRFREKIPHITVATDIICGFPGETKEAFENSLRLIRQTKPDIVNVSKFFPRPGTAASRMRELFVPASEIKSRSRKIAALAKETGLLNNNRWIGWRGTVLIDEVGKADSWIGRNFAYKPVVFPNRGSSLLGMFVEGEIVDAAPTFLRGRMLNRT